MYNEYLIKYLEAERSYVKSNSTHYMPIVDKIEQFFRISAFHWYSVLLLSDKICDYLQNDKTENKAEPKL